MELFTIKDFIKYNNPCFNCKQLINLHSYSLESGFINTPFINDNIINFQLKASYLSYLKLEVNLNTSCFTTNSLSSLKDYLALHRMKLLSKCNCGSEVESTVLDFDLDHGFLKPFKLSFESYIVYHQDDTYQLVSYHEENASIIHIDNAQNSIWSKAQEFPLITNNFTSSQDFLDKIKTYLTFI